MAEKILLSFSQYTIALEAGAACKSTISIHNRGSIVDQFTILVQGLDESWYELSASSVKLFPGDQESIILTIHPPKDPSSKAGKYPFSVQATSVNDPSVTATELGTLEIQPFHEFVAEIHPTRREARTEADFQVTLRNRANYTETFKLSAQDEEAACQFRFENDVIKVAAGESVKTTLYAMAQKRPKFGAKKQCAFAVNVVPERDSEAAQRLSGQVVYRPMIPRWVLMFGLPLAVLFSVALWRFWPVEKPIIDAFSVSPESVMPGDSAVIHWQVHKANDVLIEPEPGNVQLQGSLTIFPTKSTVFTITAKNRRGTKKQAKAELTVVYPLPQIVSFTASPRHVKNPNKGVKLSWKVHNVDQVKIQPGIGDVDSVGSTTIFPEWTTTYTLVATNKGGDAEKGIEVILETDKATLARETGEVEKRMKDYIATGEHLYQDKHLYDQAVEKFQLSRQEYKKFEDKYGSEPNLRKLDRAAQQWIERIGFESGKESAHKIIKQSMEEKITSAKLLYQMGRFSDAEKDFQACSEKYLDFKKEFGEDQELRALSDMSQQWIEKMSVESEKEKAFDEAIQAMREHLVLGRGFHDRGQYDLAIEELQTCRQYYKSFQERFGVQTELKELDAEAEQGIKRAELAKEIESR